MVSVTRLCSSYKAVIQSELQSSDAEFTAARLLISKMKGEVLNVMNKAKQAETNLTDQHKLTEAKERELSEYRNKFVQYEQRSAQLQEDMRETEKFEHAYATRSQTIAFGNLTSQNQELNTLVCECDSLLSKLLAELIFDRVVNRNFLAKSGSWKITWIR